MNYSIFQEVLTLLAAAVAVVALFRRLHLPPILGYLFLGVVAGPHGAGLITDSENVRFLAEFGVVFLMFSIGLEFSLPQLLTMRRAVLGLGTAQVAFTAAVAGIAAWLAGLSFGGAFAVGGIVAMSSTAIVSKQLAEQLELHSRHGRSAIAILLFQDMAVIPFLLLIPALAGGAASGLGGESLASAAAAMGKGTLIFVAVIAAGYYLLRPLLRTVAAARSEELFMLTVLAVSLGAAWATHEAGLSLALGAFLAGMMIGETEFRHQVEGDIRPFRDVLLGLFFVTVGMLLNPFELPRVWPWVALLLILIVLGKGALIMGLERLINGAEPGVALRTGLTLAHVGEFSFVLLSLAVTHGALDGEGSQPLLIASVLSMVLAPLAIRANYAIATRLFPQSYAAGFGEMAHGVESESEGLEGHVILCGYAHFGQNVARLLEHEGIDYVALDLEPERVREAHDAGFNVHYGDATRRDMLAAAGLERARAVVISYRTIAVTERILENLRATRPELPVLVRARTIADMEHLKARGATEVFPETLETSLMLASQLMIRLGVPATKVLRRMREVHADHYGELKGFFAGHLPVFLETPDSSSDRLHTVTLPAGAHAAGRTLEELALDELEVVVTAVRRGGIRGPQPQPHTLLQEGDALVLYGTPSQLERAEGRLLNG
ncbi:cation:proton antiporter [Endothiovibrio diazotrophicus]